MNWQAIKDREGDLFVGTGGTLSVPGEEQSGTGGLPSFRVCLTCREDFAPTNMWHRHCSTECRILYHRRRYRLQANIMLSRPVRCACGARLIFNTRNGCLTETCENKCGDL